MKRQAYTLTLGVVLSLALGGMVLWSTYQILVIPQGNAFDFFTLWYGGRVLWAGGNPYTLDTAREIQIALVGHPVDATANQQGFAYPAYTAALLGPLLAFPFPLAVTIWCALQLVALQVALLLTLLALDWKPKPVLVGVMAFGALIFRYPIIVYVIGQTIAWVLVWITLGMALYRKGYDVWAGCSLILAFLRPELALLPSVAITLWAIRSRRWRFVWGLGGGGLVLLVGSLALRPTWPLDFIAGMRLYAGYAPVIWPPMAVLPLLGVPLIALGITLSGLVAWRAWSRAEESLPWLVASTVTLTAMLIPQTGSYTLTMLVLPLWVAMSSQSGALGRFDVLLVLTLVSPWAYFRLRNAGIYPELEHLMIPLQVAVTLGWADYRRWRL